MVRRGQANRLHIIAADQDVKKGAQRRKGEDAMRGIRQQRHCHEST